MDFDNDLTEEKVLGILNKKKEPEMLMIDLKLIKIIKIIFMNNKQFQYTIYPKIRNFKNLNYLVDIIDHLFGLPKTERVELYKADFKNIKNKFIHNIINDIKIEENIEFLVDKNMIQLYKIMLMTYGYKINLLIQYIYWLIIYISFMLHDNKLLNFILCTTVNKICFKKYNRIFNENEVSTKEKIWFDIIIKIFSDEFPEDKLLIFCCFVLTFNHFKTQLKYLTTSSIIKAIDTSLILKANVVDKMTDDQIIKLIKDELDAINIINSKIVLNELFQKLYNTSIMEKNEKDAIFREFNNVLDSITKQHNHLDNKIDMLKKENDSLKEKVENIVLEINKLKIDSIRKEYMINNTNKKIDEIKDRLICPITSEYIKNPGVTEYGHTYERAAIERWLRTRNTDPNSNLQLNHREIYPNNIILNII